MTPNDPIPFRARSQGTAAMDRSRVVASSLARVCSLVAASGLASCAPPIAATPYPNAEPAPGELGEPAPPEPGVVRYFDRDIDLRPFLSGWPYRKLDLDLDTGRLYYVETGEAYTLRELVAYTAQVLGLRRVIIGLPDVLARLQAGILERLPNAPFTMDNYRSMQVPSVCTDNGFERLGITPRSLEAVVPGYLAGTRKERLFSDLRSTAGRD